MRKSPELRAFEADLWAGGYVRIAGVDEAGRGCLAGPVVAAAVILQPGVEIDGVNDSKLLSPAKRDELFGMISRSAASVGVGLCSPEEIDRLNILHASLEAMRRAVLDLTPAPEYLLIDGNMCFPACSLPYETIVKGDQRSQSIAAASIVAKVTRDRMMEMLHTEFPEYGWSEHKGYATAGHYAALEAHGPSPYHRNSFRLVPGRVPR